MADLPKPPPPIVGKVTHFSIELYWGEGLVEATKVASEARNTQLTQQNQSELSQITRRAQSGRDRVRLQEEDRLSQWAEARNTQLTQQNQSELSQTTLPAQSGRDRVCLQEEDWLSQWAEAGNTQLTQQNQSELSQITRPSQSGRDRVCLQEEDWLSQWAEARNTQLTQQNQSEISQITRPAQSGRIRVCLQEEDRLSQWGNIYTGYAKSHTVSGLEPHTEYKYRIRFQNNYGNSAWGPHTTVSTTKEPVTGEHLHKAIIRQDIPGIEDILENHRYVKIDVPDKYGFSGLMQASQKGYLDIVDVLLKYDADVHQKNEAGKTALMLACFAGKQEVVMRLREHGARYEDFDKGGSTPMHWAVDGGNTRLIEWMIKDGADVNMKDCNSKWTPLLRCASVSGSRDVALSLLMSDADINAQDKDGKTALMIAILNGHQSLMELLLKRKADLNVKNEYGKTALVRDTIWQYQWRNGE
ncbi:hypothetical protein ScPMuIL_007152 [Solemya velum]